LRAAARALAHERARAAEERASRERLRRRQEEARARKERLAALAKRGEAAWADVENLIELRSRPAYEQAAALLADLAELAENAGEHESFARRLAELHRRHERKRQFIVRLKEAGLLGLFVS